MKNITKELVDFVFNLETKGDGFHYNGIVFFDSIDEIIDDMDFNCDFTDSVFIEFNNKIEIMLEIEDQENEYYDVELNIDNSGMLNHAMITSINDVEYKHKF